MKLDFLQKGGIFLGTCLLILILADTLMTKPIHQEDTILIEGDFSRIEKNQPKRSVSISYNVFLKDKAKFYKILPDWVECFNYKSFINEIKVGQPIQIYIRKDNGLRSSDLPVIVSLVANKKEFLNLNCINEDNENNKIKVPLSALFSIILFGTIIYWRNRIHKIKG